MRYLSLIIVAALLFSGVAFAAPISSPGIGDKLGQGSLDSDPGKIFRFVRYMPAAGTIDADTLATESIVIWDTLSDDGVTITTTTTSYDSAVAGIIAVAALTPDSLGRTAVQDIGSRNWTWLQTYGIAEVRVQADSDLVDVKDAMSCGSTAGEACDYLGGGTDALTQGMAGFFLDDATAGEDNVEVFLNID